MGQNNAVGVAHNVETDLGSIRIADEVVSVVAGLAATEVP